MSSKDKIVSFEDELLILVDEYDNEIGFDTKDICHNNSGILHRAFSIFVFNDKNELLLQQRSSEKRLWPLFWSNSCCSHPRKGETYEYATARRLKEELGLTIKLTYLYKFQYQAKYKNEGSENELCSVYIGKSNVMPVVNETEIAEWKYISIDTLDAELLKNPNAFTPWFKMEWKELKIKYMVQILAL
ncbi:MAG: isopentenyl-diphosphate Delta-isomerase [Calditrichaceae bacterium]|nr:isopentenyl-diphosphate Delta-isomerase [Calditrichaceae bacterium]